VAHYIEDFKETRKPPSVYTPLNKADVPSNLGIDVDYLNE
jgi:hypothetical protein